MHVARRLLNRTRTQTGEPVSELIDNATKRKELLKDDRVRHAYLGEAHG